MTPTPNDAERQRFGLTAWMAIVAAIAVEQCGLLLPDQGVWWALAGGCLWTGFAVVVRVGPRWLFRRVIPATTRKRLAAAPLVGRWGGGVGRLLTATAVMAAAVGTTAAMAPGGGSPEQLLMAIFRGTLLALEICVMVTAFVYLGLVESHAIFACYPLLIAALSGPVLGEAVGSRVSDRSRFFSLWFLASALHAWCRSGNVDKSLAISCSKLPHQE